ncbi:putative F-box protein At5g62660 [Papaver somniferum]|uniref:putative F-box protein At5g62660 n=1 Tax=Papaver somniferum TaxID=3469 RepID=UPI000E6F8AF9|nr:putative F-box protein At5g62660 [Papaver somniferum]
MGKQHPCIAWVPILWDMLLSTKNKAEDSVEEDPPPVPNLRSDIITNTLPNLPAYIITNTLDRHPFSELPELIRAIEKSRPIPHLPSDIISNILSRLPAKSIFQLWQQTNQQCLLYQLTTDPYFMRTHLDRRPATPTIVGQSSPQSIDNNIKLFLFDGIPCNEHCNNIEEVTSLDLRSWNCRRPIYICGSYDGFLLLSTINGCQKPIFCIWNPITKEQVIVTSPPCVIPEPRVAGPIRQNPETWVCGFYFHPCKKEYEVICVRLLTGTNIWVYQILNLRTKQGRSVGSCFYPPCRRRLPVFINGTFYWMVNRAMYWVENGVYPSLTNSILSFNLETEKFNTMEVVKPSNESPMHRDVDFELFDLDGELGLFDPLSSTDPQVAVIWVFNYNAKRWDKKHLMTSSPVRKYWKSFREIDYVKMSGEFILHPWHSLDKEWYVYTLRLGTWKVFNRKTSEKHDYVTAIHTHSLVSLDAADSVIPIQWE